MTNAELAAMLGTIADSIEARGATGSAGIVRVAAHRLAELPTITGTPDRCAGCGAPIVQPRTGRPRRWCGRGVCEARKTPENATVGA